MALSASHDAVVRSIYDAALGEDAWQALTRKLCDYLEGESSVIWYADGSAPPKIAACNHPQSTLDDYAEHFLGVDPWTRVVIGQGLVSTAFRGSDLIEDRSLRQTEYYYDFMRKAGIFANIGAHLRLGAGTFSAVGVHRHPSASRFSANHRARLQSLIPHLEQMLTLRRHFAAGLAAADLSTAALYLASPAIVICDARARVMFANAAAETLAAEKRGIKLPAAGAALAATKPDDTPKLRQMIAAAAGGSVGGALCLSDSNGDRLLLVVSPLPPSVQENPGRALVAIRSEAPVPSAQPKMLMDLFGLTAAEADLASGLMQNHSLREIRLRRGVSENTVRTQLAHVLGKTGTSNQRELVRLLGAIPTDFVPG